jgi:hypothetical protein
MNEKRRGGKRPGAGRPKSTGADDPDFRKVAVTVRLSAWVADCLRQRKGQGPLVEAALIRRYGWTPPREAQENISQPAPGTRNRRTKMKTYRIAARPFHGAGYEFLTALDKDWGRKSTEYENSFEENDEGELVWVGEGEEPTAAESIGAYFGGDGEPLEFDEGEASYLAEYLCAEVAGR